MVFTPSIEGGILTNALSGLLRRQAASDDDPHVLATAGSVHRICHEPTFREVISALARDAALGNPRACLRSLGTLFFTVLETAQPDIAEALYDITPGQLPELGQR